MKRRGLRIENETQGAEQGLQIPDPREDAHRRGALPLLHLRQGLQAQRGSGASRGRPQEGPAEGEILA